MSASVRPSMRVRSARPRPWVSSVEPATKPRFQPYPSRNRARNRISPPSGGRDRREHRREGDDRQAGEHDPDTAEPVGQATGDRRQREHPERVGADDEPDGRKAVAVRGHVQRRHGHDQDHDDLDRDQRDDRHRDVRVAAGCARARLARVPVVRLVVEVRSGRRAVRVGPEHHEREDRGAAPTKTIGSRYAPA